MMQEPNTDYIPWEKQSLKLEEFNPDPKIFKSLFRDENDKATCYEIILQCQQKTMPPFKFTKEQILLFVPKAAKAVLKNDIIFRFK
jgi:hypothetical protein